MKKTIFLVIILITLATLLRFFQLGRTPISLEWDEVALGYDAYSVLHTGRDQFGKFFPITFRSIDDYKPPLYIYADIIPTALLGLNEFSTRFPSAFFGFLAVILTYILVKELFYNSSRVLKYSLALISAFFLAISPWHLQFSRAAFETNISVTITVAAVLFFLRAVRTNNNKDFFLSSLFFGTALFSYHSTRVVTPLILISLMFVFHRRLTKKALGIFFSLYIIFFLLFIPIAFSKDAQVRFLATNDLNTSYYQEISANEIFKDKMTGGEFGGKIFHNRRLAVFNYENASKFVINYLRHFSFEFLFEKGDVPLHHAPGFGMMYFFDLPLLLIGIFCYLKKYISRENIILPLWLLFAPIPAAVTWQSPHAVRTEIILPTLQIISALGLLEFILFIRKESKVFFYFMAVFIAILISFGFGSYLHQYYIHTNIELSKNWLYGRKEAAIFTELNKSKYNRIIVSAKVDMPYIFWLYYTKYSPELLLQNGGTLSGGFAENRNHFDKYEFHNFDFEKVKQMGEKILLVGVPEDFPEGVNTLKNIRYLDGTLGLRIVSVNNK